MTDIGVNRRGYCWASRQHEQSRPWGKRPNEHVDLSLVYKCKKKMVEAALFIVVFSWVYGCIRSLGRMFFLSG